MLLHSHNIFFAEGNVIHVDIDKRFRRPKTIEAVWPFFKLIVSSIYVTKYLSVQWLETREQAEDTQTSIATSSSHALISGVRSVWCLWNRRFQCLRRSAPSKCLHGNTFQWPHNERDGISNHRPYNCLPNGLFNRLFRHRSEKTPKLRVTGLCEGSSPVTGEFPAQRASNAETVSIWWRHHDTHMFLPNSCNQILLCRRS